MIEKLKELTEIELIELLKKCTMNLNIDYKRKLKADNVEFELSNHASRARQTTVYANSFKANKSYQNGLDFVKEIIKLL